MGLVIENEPVTAQGHELYLKTSVVTFAHS